MKTSNSWILGLVALAWFSSSVATHDQTSWIGTWQTSPIGLPTVTKIGPYTLLPPAKVKGTIRYRLRISEGGSQIRLRLSNEYGEVPLAVQAVSVGLAGDGF